MLTVQVVRLKSGRLAFQFTASKGTNEVESKILWWDDVDQVMAMSHSLTRIEAKYGTISIPSPNDQSQPAELEINVNPERLKVIVK